MEHTLRVPTDGGVHGDDLSLCLDSLAFKIEHRRKICRGILFVSSYVPDEN